MKKNNIIESIQNGQVSKYSLMANDEFFKRYEVEKSRQVIIIELRGTKTKYHSSNNQMVEIDDVEEFLTLAKAANILVIQERRYKADEK